MASFPPLLQCRQRERGAPKNGEALPNVRPFLSTGERNSLAVEIAWRWLFLVFALAVTAGVGLVSLDAVRLGPGDLAVFRSRNLFWMVLAVSRLFRRHQEALAGSLVVLAVTLGGFWVLAGAAVRAACYGRRLLWLVALRAASLVAGSAALFSCLAMILEVAGWCRPSWGGHVGPPLQVLLVGAFCLAVYLCWRWVSLLLAVLETAPGLSEGWQAFAASVPELAMASATNSTLKWLVLAAVTMPPAVVMAALPADLWRVKLAALGLWVLVFLLVSGYFGVRLREIIQGVVWSADSLSSRAA